MWISFSAFPQLFKNHIKKEEGRKPSRILGFQPKTMCKERNSSTMRTARKIYIFLSLPITTKTAFAKLVTMPGMNAIVSRRRYVDVAAMSISPGLIAPISTLP